MIGVTFGEAIFWFFLLQLLLVGVLWQRESSRQKRHERRNGSSRLFHCDSCHHNFVLDEDIYLCRCPRCNAVCIRARRRELE